MAGPTTILVHGAFADPSGWSRLYAELAGDGLTIKAPPNPLRGVTVQDAEYTKCVIEQVEGPVLLVGHAYGGAVITASGVVDNVVALVYVEGMAPDEGEDLAAFQSTFPAAVVAPYIKPSPLPDGGTEFTIDPSRFHEAFCADLPDAEAAFVALPAPALRSCIRRESANPGLADAPVVGGPADRRRRDPSDVHRFSYDRMGATVTVVEGAPHVVMLSRPAVVADGVREAARSCAPGGLRS